MRVETPAGRRARAFTLVELLVVVGIIAVLISILLPSLGMVRRQAKEVACSNNLRQLTAGAIMYQNTFKKLPPPGHNGIIGETIVPTDIQSRLINQLSEFLGYPAISNSPDWPAGSPSPAPTPDQLPNVMLSIEYAENPAELNRGPAIGNGPTYWYTGYSYFGRIDDGPNPLGVVMKPDRVANGRKRGVLWADSLVYWASPAPYFYANHAAFNGFRPGDTPQGLRGQHVGWSDGSVIWTRLDRNDVSVALAGSKAAYRVNGDGYYWWN